MNRPADPTGPLPQDFDAEWYAARYPDVALSGMAPEAHYLRIGRLIGRAPCAAREPADGAPPAAMQTPEAAARRFGADPAALPQVPPAGTLLDSVLIPAPAGLPRGAAAGPRAPRPPMVDGFAVRIGETEIARLAAPEALARLGGLAALRRLLPGALEGLSLHDAAGGRRAAALPEAGALPDIAPTCLLQGPARIERAWFAAEGRLRLGLQGADDDAGRSPAAPAMLRVFQPDAETPSLLIACGAVACGEGGPAWGDVLPPSEFMPLLVEVSDAAGRTLGLGLLPYPSLLEGGVHAAEVVAHRRRESPMEEFWRLSAALLAEHLGAGPNGDAPFALSALSVDLGGATGAEPVFSAACQEWLSALFGLRLQAEGGEADDPGQVWLQGQTDEGAVLRPGLRALPGRSGGATLCLPADAVPTVMGLVWRGQAGTGASGPVAGPFLVADRVGRRPLWSVAVPLDPASALRVPGQALPFPRLRPAEAAAPEPPEPAHWTAPLHLAVALRTPAPAHESRLLMPVAPDSTSPPLEGLRTDLAGETVEVALRATAPADSLACLHALAAQEGEAALRVTLWTEPAAGGDADWAPVAEALAALFPGRWRLEPGPRPSPARLAGTTGATWLMLAEDTVLAHDARLVGTLAGLLRHDPSAAAAAAALAVETAAGKGTRLAVAGSGLFPAGVSFAASPCLSLAELPAAEALPAAVYPVFANTLACILLRPEAVRAAVAETAALAGPCGDLELARALTAAGWRSLCTTVVRATTQRPPLARDVLDPFGLAALAPARWDEVLSSVTVLRDLR